MVPSLVCTDVYLGSLTFSCRPDEAVSGWMQQKLALNKYVNIALFQQTGVNTTWIQS